MGVFLIVVRRTLLKNQLINMIILKIPQVCINHNTCRRIPHNMSNQRMHWAKKNRWNSEWKDAVGWEVNLQRKQFGKLPLLFAKIQVVIHAVRLMDYDGAYNAVKPLIDGLKGSVIVDDSPAHIDLKVVQKHVASYAQESVEIHISG